MMRTCSISMTTRHLSWTVKMWNVRPTICKTPPCVSASRGWCKRLHHSLEFWLSSYRARWKLPPRFPTIRKKMNTTMVRRCHQSPRSNKTHTCLSTLWRILTCSTFTRRQLKLNTILSGALSHSLRLLSWLRCAKIKPLTATWPLMLNWECLAWISK